MLRGRFIFVYEEFVMFLDIEYVRLENVEEDCVIGFVFWMLYLDYICVGMYFVLVVVFVVFFFVV